MSIVGDSEDVSCESSNDELFVISRQSGEADILIDYLQSAQSSRLHTHMPCVLTCQKADSVLPQR